MSKKPPMRTESIRASLRDAAASHRRHADGTTDKISFETRKAGLKVAARFSDFLRDNISPHKRIDNLKTADVKAYVKHRLEVDGIAPRTLQNEVSLVRVMLRQKGRGEFADKQLQNKDLGVPKAPRAGAKESPSKDFVEANLAKLPEREEVALRLAYHLGLRKKEVVMSGKHIETWKKFVDAGKFEGLPVLAGTKGGRARYVQIPADERADAIRTIHRAYALCKAHPKGNLIDQDGLKESLDRLANQAKAAGFKYSNSPHSLRYLYAQRVYKEAIAKGMTTKEAEMAVVTALGHGDSRTQLWRHVYSKGMQ